jgi:phenylpropionate dioxygenase-like ring-hydroxylating dioxygenase large terminal subunit
VEADERSGLVFVTQVESDAPDQQLDGLPPLLPPEATLVASNVHDTGANWKLVVDSFLEGYHTRFTHRDTFYPVQYDNLTVVETFGRNHRITFPYRSIEKLRDVPSAERQVDGRVLTYVYHLFPNVALITLPEHMRMIVIEPLAVDRSRVLGYTLRTPSRRFDGKDATELERASDFAEAGGAEDSAVTLAIQRGLASDANEFFQFGRFEGVLTDFHRTLQATIDAATGAQSSAVPPRSFDTR